MAASCAACGKSGESLKVCDSCERVWYCNSTCRRAHHPEHREECDNVRLAMFSEKLSKMTLSDPDADDPLFQDDPPKEECPLCYLPMPRWNGYLPITCCGKSVCEGCIDVLPLEMSIRCAFCREPIADYSDVEEAEKEEVRQLKRRMDARDATATHLMACSYSRGLRGLQRNEDKAMELWKRAADLGSLRAHAALASKFAGHSQGVEKNAFKAIQHYEAAAMGGHEASRYSLGALEQTLGKTKRAMKHFMISANAGYGDSLKRVGEGYRNGHVSKDDYAKTLRAFKDSQDQMDSSPRRAAAAKKVNCPSYLY